MEYKKTAVDFFSAAVFLFLFGRAVPPKGPLSAFLAGALRGPTFPAREK